MRMLEESLRRLQTDHLDIWQIHEVIYENDPDLIFAPNGAAEALLEAKKQGKVRFVGFTGHKSLHPSSDAHSWFSLRYGANAAQLLRCELQKFRAAGLPEASKQGCGVFGNRESLGGSGELVKFGGVTAEEGFALCRLSLPCFNDDQRDGIS